MRDRNHKNGRFRRSETSSYKMTKHDGFDAVSWQAFQEAAAEKYDFATCQRPDGSYYGTGGTCRKGSEVKGGVPKDEKKTGSKSSGGGTPTAPADVKTLRKDMISARNAESAARKARKEAEAGGDKAKAKEARAAHIQAKKDKKAAEEKFQKGQAAAGDVKRFGRESERAKATDKELRDALASKKLSPTKAAAVERELRLRASGSPMAAQKQPQSTNTANITLKDAQKRGLTTGGSKNPDWKTVNEKTSARKTVRKTSNKDRAKD